MPLKIGLIFFRKLRSYKELLLKILNNKKLVLVSNRGPYSFSRGSTGNLVESRGGGGLVSAFLSLLSDIDVDWYSVARSEVDAEIGLDGTEIGPRKQSAAKFLRLDEKIYSSYYNNMCNEVLWFIQHSLWDNTYQPVFGGETSEAWNSYKVVNKLFGKALAYDITKGSKQQTIVMFQDYHLYLAASFLPKIADVWTGHFTHIPWPAAEIISVLPAEILVSILEGLLAHQLIGFHCEQYVQNFIEACERFLQVPVDIEGKNVRFKERWVPVRPFPISIDARALEQEAELSQVQSFKHLLEPGQQFIFRADRVDPSKNIVRGFLSFQKMLELAPQLRGRVTFVAYLYESRNDLTYYRQYLKEVKKTVAAINSRYSTSGWQPIRLRLADNYLETLAAYKHFDVLLVNSIADGMNLVAKEGPILNKNNGVVVLSAKTGAYNELSHFCLPINPFDINETAINLRKALAMSKQERALRSSLLKNTIRTNNSAKWLYYQLNNFSP